MKQLEPQQKYRLGMGINLKLLGAAQSSISTMAHKNDWWQHICAHF